MGAPSADRINPSRPIQISLRGCLLDEVAYDETKGSKVRPAFSNCKHLCTTHYCIAAFSPDGLVRLHG